MMWKELMQPTMDLRLQSMSRSLESVILPAIDIENALAVTQAHVIIGHIELIRRLLDYLPEYDRLEYRDNLAVAADLTSAAQGGPEVQAAVAALRGEIDAAPVDDAHTSPAELRNASEELARAGETLVDAMGVDGDASSQKRVINIAMESLGKTSRRELRWFDPNQDPAALLNEWRSTSPALEGASR
jgi:ATP phosphoribosyltransferase regulatory subunit HisZ